LNNFEVILVSAYGRGDLLASELQTRGFQVGLLDFSVALGERSFADIEGPFPIVRPNPLLPAHLEWLMTHSFDEVTNGFAIWLKEGPLEFRGPLAAHYQNTHKALMHFKDLGEDGKSAQIGKKAASLDFEDGWAIQFAHGFSANELHRSTECHLTKDHFPLQQPIYRTVFAEEGIKKVHKDVRASGAQWISAEALYDLQLDKSGLSEIEFKPDVKGGEKQTVKAKYWVWCLSSEETASLSRKVAQKLFSNVAIADWSWRRFQVHGSRSILSEIVPSYVVMIDDLHFPWTYDNFVVLKRRTNELSDGWVRLPADVSARPEAMKKFSGKLLEKLNSRFVQNPFEIEVPWSAGPPLFPVFEPETLKKFKKPSYRNLVFEGAEGIARLDWSGRFQAQTETLARLTNLKMQDAAKHKKDTPSDQALHAP
jgi:hypothetical protein